MAHTTITRDPAFTDYHCWDLKPAAGKSWTLSCVCGLECTFGTKATAKAALRIHMA